jgi:hypothetical protein
MRKANFGMGLICLVALGTAVYLIYGNLRMSTDTAFRLKEPMLISSNRGESYYMIPANTVLHFQRGFSEGHQLYSVEVLVKGELSADRINKDTPTESTWLYRIDADEVAKIMNTYPISKDDLIRILRARKVTRDELAQIVRDWKDE